PSAGRPSPSESSILRMETATTLLPVWMLAMRRSRSERVAAWAVPFAGLWMAERCRVIGGLTRAVPTWCERRAGPATARKSGSKFADRSTGFRGLFSSLDDWNAALVWQPSAGNASNPAPAPWSVSREPRNRRHTMRIYVMVPAALEHERLL